MIGRTVSHYRILEKLGGGGMGVVYKAEDTKLERTVALKFLPPELIQNRDAKARFINEARAASALQHHNICTIHEIDETPDGGLFISMDCYEGRTLKERIAEGPLPREDAIDILSQVAAGLSEAHAAGMVHRDIKPANIMLTDRGVVKILDFGLAKLAGQARVTRTGTTMGTVAYMSPEQAKGEETDARADIWSLGVILYEMLTGRLPFEADYEVAMIYAIINDVPRPVREMRSDLPEDLVGIIGRALEKDARVRYQSVSELLGDLERLQAGTVERADLASARNTGNLRRWIGGGAMVTVMIAIVLFVIVRTQIGKQPPAAAGENTLLILFFGNMTDPADEGRIGEMIATLLIADLSESRFVQVVSSQRLKAVLKQFGVEDVREIDAGVAAEVAERVNARWMLTGNVIRPEPRMTVVGELVEVKTGNTIASQRITGEEGSDVFAIVDMLSVEIREDLSLPEAALREFDPDVAEVTTHSQEAYAHYLKARDLMGKYYMDEAEAELLGALAADSTFALAHLLLFLNGLDAGNDHLAKAVAYSSRVRKWERHLIDFGTAYQEGDHDRAISELEQMLADDPHDIDAHRLLGDYYKNIIGDHRKAIEHFLELIQIDPMDKLAYNYLAYSYHAIGDVERSLWAINKYIELAPDEANPYDTRGELYAHNGRLDEAIESFKKALEEKPDYYGSIQSLGMCYVFKRDYASAEDAFRRLFESGEKEMRSLGRYLLARIPLHQGRYVEALRLLDEGISMDRLEGYEGDYYTEKYFYKAALHLELENLFEARKTIDQYLELSPERFWSLYEVQSVYVSILRRGGWAAQADSFMLALEAEVRENYPERMRVLWTAAAWNEHYKGNDRAALEYLQKRVDASSQRTFADFLHLGRLSLEAGRLGDAVEYLEKARSRHDGMRFFLAGESPMVHYYLGRAYEDSGWVEKARGQYEELLEIWKNADTGIPEREDAGERLERLERPS